MYNVTVQNALSSEFNSAVCGLRHSIIKLSQGILMNVAISNIKPVVTVAYVITHSIITMSGIFVLSGVQWYR